MRWQSEMSAPIDGRFQTNSTIDDGRVSSGRLPLTDVDRKQPGRQNHHAAAHAVMSGISGGCVRTSFGLGSGAVAGDVDGIF